MLSSSSSLWLLMVRLLWGHHWPTVCAAVAAAAAATATATKVVAENDTAVVGSLVHLSKVAAPGADLLGAGSRKHVDDFFNDDKFAKQGYKKSHHIDDADGFAKHDTFHTKDGDGFGYAQHFEFDKKGGDKKGGGYHESSSYDDDDAAGSMPKFSQWHFEQNSDAPAKSYRYEGGSGGVGGDHSKGKLVGPDYEESKGSGNRRSKRKKEPQPSATEYDNYEYADVEEADDAPADFEGDEGADPEYGALYADADAYDYY